MSNDTTHNGWVNRDTWAAAAHLENDPALAAMAKAVAKPLANETQAYEAGLEMNAIFMDAEVAYHEGGMDRLERRHGNLGVAMAELLRDVTDLGNVHWTPIMEQWIAEVHEDQDDD